MGNKEREKSYDEIILDQFIGEQVEVLEGFMLAMKEKGYTAKFIGVALAEIYGILPSNTSLEG